MPIVNVLRVEVRPERSRRYAELCHELAESAKNRDDAMHWTAHESRIGGAPSMGFVVSANDFSGLEALGTPDEMFQRVLGQQRALDWIEETGACVLRQEETVSMDRPDLSYPPEKADRSAPFALLTLAHAKHGHEDACEELIRKVAEAIPKVGAPTRVIAYQTILGDLSMYWTVRPMASLAELDKQLPPAELLNQAFGPSEGGLIYRSGLEALTRVERQIVAYRPELSHPG